MAGGLSLLIQTRANSHARQVLFAQLAENRAHWAVQEELGRLQAFYSRVAQLREKASELRLQQQQAGGRMNPSGSASALENRLEEALKQAASEMVLLDEDLQLQFEDALTPYRLRRGSREVVGSSLSFEQLHRNLVGFQYALARRYRDRVDVRRSGRDLK